MQQSPYLREARARIDAVRAEAEGRILLPNPTAVVTREGAGYAAFFQIEQQLPISGRRNVLKQVSAAEIRVAESDAAGLLWSARTDLRLAFYRLIAAQRRQTVVKDGMQEIEEVARVLSVREREGEGSRYDRLRAQRELAEYRSQVALLQTDAAQARAALLSYLPSDTKIDGAAGELATSPPPAADALVQRALLHRSEYIAEQRQIERYRLEARAAGRLRYPKPLAIAGIKRGEVVPGFTQTASAIGINIPLPVFNKGQTEVARSQAEIERTMARRDLLEKAYSR
jgi:cobalt-zinc-cadmium efflux system outer membrane protein